jgi:hypothetical protein
MPRLFANPTTRSSPAPPSANTPSFGEQRAGRRRDRVVARLRFDTKERERVACHSHVHVRVTGAARIQVKTGVQTHTRSPHELIGVRRPAHDAKSFRAPDLDLDLGRPLSLRRRTRRERASSQLHVDEVIARGHVHVDRVCVENRRDTSGALRRPPEQLPRDDALAAANYSVRATLSAVTVSKLAGAAL